MHAVLADRPEQRLGEPAVPAAAHHQQLGPGRCIQQHLRGVPLHHRVPDLHIPRRAGRRPDGISDDLLRELLPVHVHHRHRIAALGAAAVGAAAVGAHLPVIGYANYLLVWGSMYQWGLAWQDGTLTRPRWRPYALAAAGAAALAGLVLAAAPAATRLLARPRWWRPVTRLSPAVMLVYLWHMVPVVIAAVAFYPTGVMPQPRIGSARWWELRPAWEILLAVILIPLIAGLLRLHRPLLRVLPTGLGPTRTRSPAVLTDGLAGAGFGLARLAIGGFAPGGRLPALALGAYACGLLLTLLSGAPDPARPSQAKTGSHATTG